MKNYFTFLFASFLLIMISSCSQSKNLSSGETIQRQWMLKTLPGFTYDELVKARAQIDLSDLEKGAAFGGCNRMFFNVVTGAKQAISFKNIGMTKMYCEESMKVEDALGKTLASIAKYELIAPHQVAFKDSSGKTLVTAVAADWD